MENLLGTKVGKNHLETVSGHTFCGIDHSAREQLITCFPPFACAPFSWPALDPAGFIYIAHRPTLDAKRDDPDIDRSKINTFIRPTIFAGFGAISFAFVCQSSSFLVYRSLAKGGEERWASVTRWSVSIALVMGVTLALGGYLNFVDETQGNILNNFSTEHKAASVARGFLAVTMVSRTLLPVLVCLPFFQNSGFRVSCNGLRRIIPLAARSGVAMPLAAVASVMPLYL